MNINTFSYENLVNRCTLVIGNSGSGKTYLIREMLFKLKDKIPNCVLFSPTNEQNEDFKGIIPSAAVISNLDGGRLVKKLQRIFKRQEEQVAVYNKVNDLAVLQVLARKLSVQDEVVDGLRDLLAEYESTKTELLNQDPPPHNLDELLSNIDKDRDRANEKLVHAYKDAIAAAYKDQKYSKDIQFSSEHHQLAKSLRINPNIMLILDDMAAFFDASVQKADVIRKVAFQGRHAHITTIISLQSDKTLIPALRSQAHFIAFTETNCLEGFSKANSIFCPKSAKQVADTMRLNKEDHIKTIYDKSADRFFYVRAMNKLPFRFGCDVFWQFC